MSLSYMQRWANFNRIVKANEVIGLSWDAHYRWLIRRGMFLGEKNIRNIGESVEARSICFCTRKYQFNEFLASIRTDVWLKIRDRLISSVFNGIARQLPSIMGEIFRRRFYTKPLRSIRSSQRFNIVSRLQLIIGKCWALAPSTISIEREVRERFTNIN